MVVYRYAVKGCIQACNGLYIYIYEYPTKLLACVELCLPS